jgi:hypothetical protein
MNKMNLKYGLIALAGLGLSANVSATDLTCSDITFTSEAYAAYEFADKACLEMVDRDGGTFAKFTATKVVPPDISPGVTNFLRFKHADGTQGPRHKSNLPRNYLVMLSGTPVRLADVDEGQDVNIYVGNEYWTAPVAAAPAATAAPAPVAAAAPAAYEPEPEPEPAPAMLPTTAGPLPWLALFGSLFLILGGALRFSRKQ